MEVSKGNRLLKIIDVSLIIMLCVALCFSLIPIRVQAAIPFFVVGAAVVAGFLAMAGIVAETRNDDKNVFEMLYDGYTENLDEQMKETKLFNQEIQSQIDENIQNGKRVTPKVSIKSNDLKSELTDFVDYLDRVSIFDETTGKYKLTLSSGVVELTTADLVANHIKDSNHLPLVKGIYNFDFQSIDEDKFNSYYHASYNTYKLSDKILSLYIQCEEDGDIYYNHNFSARNISVNTSEFGRYENMCAWSFSRSSEKLWFTHFFDFSNPAGTAWTEQFWVQSAIEFTPSHLEQNNLIDDMMYWYSLGSSYSFNGGSYRDLYFNVAYLKNGLYTLTRTNSYYGQYYSPAIRDGANVTISNDLLSMVGDSPSIEEEVSFGDFINWDNVQAIETVIDNLEKEDIIIQVPVNPITEGVRENTTIKDFVQDVDIVDGLVQEGVDVDKPVMEITSYEGGFPTLALSTIWDYVIYLFNQASGFIIFISSYFSAIPELIRFSFLGGFVLLVIVGLLKRIL